MELKQQDYKVYLKNVLPYLIFFGVSFFLLLPFITGFALHGHDLLYHLQAVKSLDVAYKNGTFFSRIYELTCQDYGYATGLFYSMIPSGLAVLIKNWFNTSAAFAIGIELTFVLFFASVIVYKFLLKLNKSKKQSLVLSVMYIIFPYFISNIYIRFAFTETWLILLVPMIAMSLYALVEEKNYFKFFIFFVIGYSLAIMIHLALTIFVTIFAFVYLMINYKEFFKKKSLILFFVACIFVLLISTAFYLPMFISLSDINLFSMGNSDGKILWKTTLYPFIDVYTNGFIGNLYLTIALCVILVIYVIYLTLFIINRKTNTRNQKIVFILSTAILFAFSPLNFLWFIFAHTFLSLIQYAWRLYLIYALFTSFQLVYILSKSKRVLFKCFIGAYVFVSVISMFLFSITFLSDAPKDFDENINMISTNYGTGSGKAGDYYPKGAKFDYIIYRNSEMVLDTNAEIIEFANYQSIKQINFNIIKPKEGDYVVVKLPFSKCDNIKAYQYEKSHPFYLYALGLEKQEIDGKEYLKLEFEECEDDAKITVDYSNSESLETYLKENPFEFIVRTENVNSNFTNFVKESSHNYSVDISVDKTAKIELPTLYYKGYKVTYKTASGVTQINEYRNENGFIEIEVSENGTLYVEYKAGYVAASNIISIIGVVGFIAFAILLYLYEKKNGKNLLVERDLNLVVNQEKDNLIENDNTNNEDAFLQNDN